MDSRLAKEFAVERNSDGSGALSLYVEGLRGPVDDYYHYTAKWISACCVARNCVLDHVLRLTHTSVTRRGGEQVPAVSNAHGDDQLIPAGLLNP